MRAGPGPLAGGRLCLMGGGIFDVGTVVVPAEPTRRVLESWH
jgi:hypothetical protein